MPPALVDRLPPIWQLLHRGQHAAGFGGQGIIERVDLAQPVQPAHGHDDLAAGLVRRRAAAIAGVAALGHDADAMRVAEREGGRDLRHGTRQDQGGGLAVIEAALIDEQRAQFIRGGADAVIPEEACELRDRRCASDRLRHSSSSSSSSRSSSSSSS